MKLPIFDSRDGRTVIGYAEGVRSAALAIRRLIDIPPGMHLSVWRRTDTMQDCLNLPDGYCYAVYYNF